MVATMLLLASCYKNSRCLTLQLSASIQSCQQHYSWHFTGTSQDHTSAKRSGTQTPEYQKLQEKFDTLIHHLGAILSSEDLADKLFAKKLITSGKQEEASLSTVPNTKKIRVLVIAVLAKVQFDTANYEKFVTVLSNISGAEHMAEFLKL